MILSVTDTAKGVRVNGTDGKGHPWLEDEAELIAYATGQGSTSQGQETLGRRARGGEGYERG